MMTSSLLGAPASMALLGHFVRWRLMNAYQNPAKTMELALISLTG